MRGYREQLPTQIVILNPPHKGAPLIDGLDKLYYITPRGDIIDAQGNTIGSIEPCGDYWRDLLTGRTWDSWKAAAHVYLLALSPTTRKHLENMRAEESLSQSWAAARRDLSKAMTGNIVQKHIRDAISGIMRRMDVAIQRMEEAT